jgi:hypothetical protein
MPVWDQRSSVDNGATRRISIRTGKDNERRGYLTKSLTKRPGRNKGLKDTAFYAINKDI